MSLGATTGVLLRDRSRAWRLSSILSEIQIFDGSLNDLERLTPDFLKFKPTTVFHLAAFTDVGRDKQHTIKAIEVNLTSTITFMNSLADSGVSRFVASGTCEEYGNAEQPVSEETMLAPLSPYSASKSAATLWCSMAHINSNFPVVILRPFMVYGPGQDLNRLVPQAIVSALRNVDLPMTAGRQTRDFIHVADVIDGYLAAGIKAGIDGHVINLGSGTELSVKDVVSRIYEMTESSARPLPGAVEYRSAELWESRADVKKALELLGWKAKISLNNGLEQTVDWYRENWARRSF